MASSGRVEIWLNLEAPFTAPLGAPAQRILSPPFAFDFALASRDFNVLMVCSCAGPVPVPGAEQQRRCSSSRATDSTLMGESYVHIYHTYHTYPLRLFMLY